MVFSEQLQRFTTRRASTPSLAMNASYINITPHIIIRGMYLNVYIFFFLFPSFSSFISLIMLILPGPLCSYNYSQRRLPCTIYTICTRTPKENTFLPLSPHVATLTFDKSWTFNCDKIFIISQTSYDIDSPVRYTSLSMYIKN